MNYGSAGDPTIEGGETEKMQTNQVNVQRWSITSRKPFDTVLAAVEGAIGRPNMVEFAAKVAAAKTFEEMQNVINASVSEIGLMEFMRLDHGAILAQGRSRRRSEKRPRNHGQPAHHAIHGHACSGRRLLCSGNRPRG